MESRQAIAARNADEILDAAERLLIGGAPLTLSAVAEEAGLSRPTVYGHFGDRARLLAALHGRSVRRVVATIESAAPDRGPPVEALRRVVEAAWVHLARHHEIVRSLAPEISGDAVHGAHHDAMALFGRLVQRGRSEGAFRDDLPAVWLVNACVGLIHTAAAAVHAGQMKSRTALKAVATTTVELCVGPAEAGREVTTGRTAGRRRAAR